jgi:hypothetical protein
MKFQLKILFFFLIGSFAMATSLKKVQILSTNNAPFFAQENGFIYSQNNPEYLHKLRKYITAHGFTPHSTLEFEFALNALSWVTAQWDHNGMNEPPKNARAMEILTAVYDEKKQFRCVEYGIVLSEVLESFGFVTRKLALRSKESAYGGFGQGHVAIEVWLNDLNKWVFLDGQFGAYLTRPEKTEPLNYFEIFSEKAAGKWDSLEVHFVKAVDGEPKASSDYKAFLKNYFGHMAVTSEKDAPTVSLLLESRETPLTFQGGPISNAIFTSDAKVMYPEMNRVAITLKYRGEAPNFPKLIKKLEIRSDEEFKKNMAAFAVEPKFIVTLFKTGPWFDHFEFRTSSSSSWKGLKNSSTEWDALEEINRFEVRAVNKFERAGPVTFIEIGYK